MTTVVKGVIRLAESKIKSAENISPLIKFLFWIVYVDSKDMLSIEVAHQDPLRKSILRVVTGTNWEGVIAMATSLSHKLEYGTDFNTDFERIAIDLMVLNHLCDAGHLWVDIFVPGARSKMVEWFLQNAEEYNIDLRRPIEPMELINKNEYCHSEESGLKYLQLLADFERFTKMVRNNYPSFTKTQRELIGSITYSHLDFIRKGKDEPLRKYLDQFFMEMHDTMKLAAYGEGSDTISKKEWQDELMGEHNIPDDVIALHYNWKYDIGGVNWNMDPGLHVNIFTEYSDGRFNETTAFVSQDSLRFVVYSRACKYARPLSKGVSLRQEVFLAIAYTFSESWSN